MVDLIQRLFPASPIPGLEPRFDRYGEIEQNQTWYDMYEYMAQDPSSSILAVSYSYQYKLPVNDHVVT